MSFTKISQQMFQHFSTKKSTMHVSKLIQISTTKSLTFSETTFHALFLQYEKQQTFIRTKTGLSIQFRMRFILFYIN